MRVLHLSPSFPYPADTGGKIGIWNLLRADARAAEVGLLSFVEEEPDVATAAELRSVCQEVATVRRPRALDGVGGAAWSLPSRVAMNVAKYRWPVYSRALERAVTRFRPDVVVAHHLHMGSYLRELEGPVRILREHNIDSDLMDRYAATLRNPLLAGFARQQARKIRATEREMGHVAHRLLMISPTDEARFREIVPDARTSVVPGVVAPDEYLPAREPGPDDPLLVVTAGTFTFPPTGEGLVHFLDRVWPRLTASVPQARFRVIGRCPEALRRRLAAAPGVEVLGRVEVVEPHLDGAHVFVVPLRAGSGIRMRILEAMAWQIPIVTTATGCEGIAVGDGRHLVVADDPGEMATAILRVAREAALARNLRREGRRLVEERYSIEAAGILLDRVYRECAGMGLPARNPEQAPAAGGIARGTT
jgi:polysaccharide biosynthesis protein PslH